MMLSVQVEDVTSYGVHSEVGRLRKVVPVIDLPASQAPEPGVKPAEPHPLAGGDPGTGS